MKAVILAGGEGTRLDDQQDRPPKPMVEIGGRPMLWHIMKIYAHYGITDFVICCGFRGYIIKEYFTNFQLHSSDVAINMKDNSIEFIRKAEEDWKVTLVDTGENSGTGGRLKRVAPFIEDQDFCFTYGDAVSDVNIANLIEFHKNKGKWATLTSVQPVGRFGMLEISDEGGVKEFKEKAIGGDGWINAGFFVLSPKVLRYIEDDQEAWELEPIQRLIEQEQLAAYQHYGYWQCMDTPRDLHSLDDQWKRGESRWKCW